jgi:hypothetical protein
MPDNCNGHKPTYRLRDYRHNCGRLLFHGFLMPGSRIEIRCPKCGIMAVYEYSEPIIIDVVKTESIAIVVPVE